MTYVTLLHTNVRILNKKRLIIIVSIVLALVTVAVFINQIGLTAFTIKEKPPACTDECSFEGKICESAKIFECSIGEDNCKHKILVETCPEEGICSTLKEGECYTPQSCDGDFHTCISDVYYKMCKDGKTVEDADTKKCPTGLMCNRDPKQFAVCIEKDY